MIQKVHLQNSLLNRHGLVGEGLGADTELGLLIHVLLAVATVEGAFAQSLLKACLVLADLSLNGVNGTVKCVLEGLVLDLRAEKSVRREDRDLKIFFVVFAAERYRCLSLGRKILVELLELFDYHFLQALTHSHLSCIYSDLHSMAFLSWCCCAEDVLLRSYYITKEKLCKEYNKKFSKPTQLLYNLYTIRKNNLGEKEG